VQINDNFAISVLAKRAAIQAVKEQLRRAGVRVSLVHCAELDRLAREYLSKNEAQLIAQSKAKWEAICGNRASDGVVSCQAIRSKAS
jgi:hypothetical protein